VAGNWCLFENDYFLSRPVACVELVSKSKAFFTYRDKYGYTHRRKLAVLLREGLSETAAQKKCMSSLASAEAERKAATARHRARQAAILDAL
jgi:hypothetical protein